MKAFSVRDLKDNPSAALRAAREHPVMVLKRNAPEAVLVHLDQDRLRRWPEVRRALALAPYQEGSLSAGNAARFAGLALAEFIEAASRQGIPVVYGNSQTLAEEASAIKAWRTDS